MAIFRVIGDACGVRVYKISAELENILANLHGEILTAESYYPGNDVNREYMAAD